MTASVLPWLYIRVAMTDDWLFGRIFLNIGDLSDCNRLHRGYRYFIRKPTLLKSRRPERDRRIERGYTVVPASRRLIGRQPPGLVV